LCPLRTFNLTKNPFTKESTNFNHHGQWWHLLPEGGNTLETFWKRGKPATIENEKLQFNFLKNDQPVLWYGLSLALALTLPLTFCIALALCFGIHSFVPQFLLFVLWYVLFVPWHLPLCCSNIQHCGQHYVLHQHLAPLPTLCAASTFSTVLDTSMCCIGIQCCDQHLCYGTIAERCSGIVQSCCSVSIGTIPLCLHWSQCSSWHLFCSASKNFCFYMWPLS